MIRKKIVVLFTLLLFVVVGHGFSQEISADDFLPPVHAKTAAQADQFLQIKKPEQVKISEDKELNQKIIEAGSAQDAANAAISKREVGSRMLRFPSGFGWIATGAGTYQVMENVVGSRVSQRQAYLRAFMEAKSKLAESLNGLSNDGKTIIAEAMKMIQFSLDCRVCIRMNYRATKPNKCQFSSF